MELTRFRCFVGTSRGFLLSTTDKLKEIKHIKPEFASEVTALSFGKEQSSIFIGYQNGSVHVFDPLENVYLDTLENLTGEGSIVGLGFIDDILIAGKSDGTVNLWNGKKSKQFKINLDENGTLNSVVLNSVRNSVGTGGEKNDFKLWDVETQQCIFKAKSLGHDNLNLPIPTSVRGITFFPEDPHLSCCCTKEGHVLLYDDRKQRRPVVKFLETKASYTTIASAYRERQCLVGTTRGYMQLLDMKAGKCMKTFTSFTGSVTSIACDPMEPYVFSTSLDRYLRVHHLQSKELLQKIYMKINLTSLLMTPFIKNEEEEEEEEEKPVEKNNNGQLIHKEDNDIDEEYESIFDNMEVIGDKVKKKKSSSKRTIEETVKMSTQKKLKTNTDGKKIKVKRKIKLVKLGKNNNG